MVTSVWPLPRPGSVVRNGFDWTWLEIRLPLGVPPSVFCAAESRFSSRWQREHCVDR